MVREVNRKVLMESVALPGIVQRLQRIGYIVEKYEKRDDGACLVWLSNRPQEQNNGAYYRKLERAGLCVSQYSQWSNEILICDVIFDTGVYLAYGKPYRKTISDGS